VDLGTTAPGFLRAATRLTRGLTLAAGLGEDTLIPAAAERCPNGTPTPASHAAGRNGGRTRHKAPSTVLCYISCRGIDMLPTEVVSSSKYSDPFVKLAEARRTLMAPNSDETWAFKTAFWDVQQALLALKYHPELLDEDDLVSTWVRTLEGAMDISCVDSTAGERYEIRAASLSFEERRAFAHALDELANWFHRRAVMSARA